MLSCQNKMKNLAWSSNMVDDGHLDPAHPVDPNVVYPESNASPLVIAPEIDHHENGHLDQCHRHILQKLQSRLDHQL